MSWYSIVILLLGYVCLSLNIECGTKFFAPFCFFYSHWVWGLGNGRTGQYMNLVVST
jgi:hypothetical protein